ncbi:MAG TPA: hypothetical protein VM554_03695 [Acidisarcina sp.]|nr:hypothetical protein [Acidisarcina sp.]
MRGKARRKPPRSHIASDFFYPLVAIEIDEVDREAHCEGMYGFAGDDPQTLTREETLAPQQALSTLCAAIGYDYTAGKFGVTGDIADPQTEIGLRFARLCQMFR